MVPNTNIGLAGGTRQRAGRFVSAGKGGMARLKIDAHLDYGFDRPTEILLALEAAPMDDQRLSQGVLTVTGCGPLSPVDGGSQIGRRTWALTEAGRLVADYSVTVDVERQPPSLAGQKASPLVSLPADVIPFLWPSRYCEADRFKSFVDAEFGCREGGDFVVAAADWVGGHLSYAPGSSNETTTAVDTFVMRQGVCRDYAHLTAALIRARDIPARLVSVYAWDLASPDFHAVVEVWLDGAWHMVDASGLAPIETMVRIAVGRDATDISFLTAFGRAQLYEQTVTVTRL
jgi:transglutaminase-like putative cysteine protease